MTATIERGTRFRQLPPDRPAPEIEEETLARWADEDLFARTNEAREGAPEFVFFEGPPTANGRPGIHHVFARTIKDLFCRHRVMRGYHVTRKAGWDTHGLPVEIEVEKGLGISGKPQIEALGVEEFNRLCRESVWKYSEEFERLSTRIGYWLDYSDPYITYSNDYIESVWWALKTLHQRGFLYQGYKVLPYCSRCGTALSSHEVAQGYRTVEDPSVYVALDLESGANSDGTPRGRRRIIVWTTTPWTLVSNTALAVNADLSYVELRKRGGADWTILLAEERAGAVLGDDYTDRWETVERMTGRDLVGQRYRRPLDWVEFGEGAHEIIVAEEFVSASDGSGVVHMSPAFGADDYAAGRRHGLAFVQPVDARGAFPEGMPVVGGRFVKEADADIIEELRRRDVLWKASRIEHSYPHCWRCGTPLLYYARTSWFVRTTAYRDRMLARNARVDWHPPETGQGRFGEWLVNNIDWAISRDRFWGTPLPVWMNDADPTEIDVIGSYAELADRCGVLPEDFDPHKPFIDSYAWPAPSGTGTMRRVPAVIDTWFDSGSMPFAQWHYPFENAEAFARHYPADFIAEGVDQTRGWFYSLLAIAAGLGDALPRNEPATVGGAGVVESDPGLPGIAAPIAAVVYETAPYQAVVVNDMVLDAAGQKMSKSKGNAVDPWATIAAHGADATRLYLVVSSQVWLPKRFDERMIRESAGRFLITLKNVYDGIFAQYANFGWEPGAGDPAPDARPAMDRWVLSRLTAVEAEADALLERFDATQAASRVMEFFDEDVSKWYVRQSRARFYEIDGVENRAAFATLHEVLTVTCRLLAPFAPFLTDWMHRELTGDSVHLASYVRSEAAHRDPGLEGAMAAVRRLANLGRAARDEAGVKVRQPLSRVVCVVPSGTEDGIASLVDVLAVELNVKRVEFVSSADALVRLEAKANFRALGRKFGKATPEAAAAVQALSGEQLRAFERGEQVVVAVAGLERELEPDDLVIVRRASGDLAVAEADGYFAAVDPAITPALRAEGLARELVSTVQRMRKAAGLQVSDRIRLRVWGNPDVEVALEEHRQWIAGETLARDLAIGAAATAGGYQDDDATQPVELDGLPVRIALTKDD